jgi:hypothetical protein
MGDVAEQAADAEKAGGDEEVTGDENDEAGKRHPGAQY